MREPEETPTFFADMDGYDSESEVIFHKLRSNSSDLVNLEFGYGGDEIWFPEDGRTRDLLPQVDDMNELASSLQFNTSVQKIVLQLYLRQNSCSYLTDNDGGIVFAQSLRTNTTLKELDLSYNRVSDGTAIELSQGLLSNEGTSLRCLNLAVNRITEVGGFEMSSALQTNQSLIHLDLSHNPVSDKTAMGLAHGLVCCKRTVLQCLLLVHCKISNVGANKLADALKQNGTLMILDLANNNVCDEGANALAEALLMNGILERLDLSHNQIQDAGATKLAQTYLRKENLKIFLDGNPVSSSVSKETAGLLTGTDAFAELYGLGCSQCKWMAWRRYHILLEENFAAAADNLGWIYRSGCGTEVCIEKAKKHLEYSIKKYHLPSSLFVLADTLASSAKISDLHQARDLISQIDKQSDVYQRGQWLLPFIERQLKLLQDADCLPIDNLKPDFIHDADLQIVAYIGRGHFGKVYLGRLCRGKEFVTKWCQVNNPYKEQWVAVKFLSVDLIETKEKDQTTLLLSERFTWQMLESCKIANMAKYIGFVDDLGNMQRGLVFELCADITNVEEDAWAAVKSFTSVHFIEDLNAIPDWSDKVTSSLRSAVVLPRKRIFPPSKILTMLQNVAIALAGIHKSGFLHRDIADRNVLCDKQGNVQLTDMGLAKFVGGQVALEGIGYDPIDKYKCSWTPGHHYALAWHAPECIGSKTQDEVFKAVFSTSSDVYSFGMLMWQCFAHEDPFDEDRFRPDDYQDLKSVEAAAKVLLSAIRAGERPDLDVLDDDTPDRLVCLIRRCWATNAKHRPTLDEIIMELGKIERETVDSRRVSLVNRSVEESKEKWFDVGPLYWPIPANKKTQRLELTSKMDKLIACADAATTRPKVDGHAGSMFSFHLRQDEKAEQRSLLREMQSLEPTLMKSLADLANQEAQRLRSPTSEDVKWIQHIGRYYHSLVPLLRIVMLQMYADGELLPSPTVFISHTGHDKQSYASPLSDHLKHNDIHNVFIDKELPIGSKGDDEMMWAAVACRHFWCVCSKHFIKKWYPMRELMVGYVRHMQESPDDFTILLDCLEQEGSLKGGWMEQMLNMKSLQLH